MFSTSPTEGPVLFTPEPFQDVFVDACVCDFDQRLLFLSAYGREAGLLQLLAAMQLPSTQGGVDLLALRRSDDAQAPKRTVFVGDARRLDKTTAKFPRGNLFGTLAHLWVFDPKVRVPDRATRSAWLLFPSDAPSVEQHDVWRTIVDLSPVPLLDAWAPTVLADLQSTGHVVPEARECAIGAIRVAYVSIPEDFESRISQMLKRGQLTVNVAAVCRQAA